MSRAEKFYRVFQQGWLLVVSKTAASSSRAKGDEQGACTLNKGAPFWGLDPCGSVAPVFQPGHEGTQLAATPSLLVSGDVETFGPAQPHSP